MQKLQKGLNRNQIKYFIIVLMFLDHLTYFVSMNPILDTSISVFSRLTAPTMAYFITEGYLHTRSRGKYLLRLFLFALASWPAFVFFNFGDWRLIYLTDGPASIQPYIQASVRLGFLGKTLVIRPLSVISTLLLCLLAVMAADSKKLHLAVKLPAILLLLWAGQFGDWSWGLVANSLSFYLFRNNRVRMWLAYTAVSLCYVFGVCQYNPLMPVVGSSFGVLRLGVLLVIPFIECLYNGQPGKKNAFNQYFFYIFYPLHLLVLGVVRWYL